jgi:hypothetical protein
MMYPGPTPPPPAADTISDVVVQPYLATEASAPSDYQPPHQYTDDAIAARVRDFLGLTREEVGLT